MRYQPAGAVLRLIRLSQFDLNRFIPVMAVCLSACSFLFGSPPDLKGKTCSRREDCGASLSCISNVCAESMTAGGAGGGSAGGLGGSAGGLGGGAAGGLGGGAAGGLGGGTAGGRGGGAAGGSAGGIGGGSAGGTSQPRTCVFNDAGTTFNNCFFR